MNKISDKAGAEIWRQYCSQLADAANIFDMPEVPKDALTQAEGARYLSRLTRLGLEIYLEGGDPYFPHFYVPSHETAKMGGDNPDNLYLSATIAGDISYRISGNIGTVAYLSFGSKANRYAIDGTMPSTGELARDDLIIDNNGNFEIIAAAENPNNSNAAWLPLEQDSTVVQVRQTFLDRRSETPATVTIDRISAGPQAPAALTPEDLEARLKRAGDFVIGTSKLFAGWASKFMSAPNELRDWGQEMFIKAGGDPSIFYVHGYWRLKPDEMLLVETEIPECEHWNLQVNNWWMESLDYRYHDICINMHSAAVDPDGKVRIAISENDPGMANWLSTASHKEGFILLRWVKAANHPIPRTRVVRNA